MLTNDLPWSLGSDCPPGNLGDPLLPRLGEEWKTVAAEEFITQPGPKLGTAPDDEDDMRAGDEDEETEELDEDDEDFDDDFDDDFEDQLDGDWEELEDDLAEPDTADGDEGEPGEFEEPDGDEEF